MLILAFALLSCAYPPVPVEPRPAATVMDTYRLAPAATITCNDGTLSPTCETCRSGCCSYHGGCK